MRRRSKEIHSQNYCCQRYWRHCLLQPSNGLWELQSSDDHENEMNLTENNILKLQISVFKLYIPDGCHLYESDPLQLLLIS